MDRSLSPQEPQVQSSHDEAKQTRRFELRQITARNIHSPLTLHSVAVPWAVYSLLATRFASSTIPGPKYPGTEIPTKIP